jgi:hypothetical protein
VLKTKVLEANAMADNVAWWARGLLERGQGFIIENPRNSFLWDVPAIKELMELAGVFSCDIHNCMYGGLKRKWTRFVTNVEGLERFLTDTCACEKVCSRTGLAHESFKPVVDA